MGVAERYLRLRIITAEPENLLSLLTDSNVEILNVVFVDSLTVEIEIRKQNVSIVEKIVTRSGGSCHITNQRGLLWNLQKIWKRPVLSAGLLVFFVLAVFVNNRIFFVKVQGNEFVSKKFLLAEAENCGITFGAKASKVRSEEVKNKLLQQFPQLQWLGVTTSGTVATIQVQERSVQDNAAVPTSAVSHIIASRDGLISKMTVYNGNPIFHVGQSVQTGDVLISGYTDCGIIQKAERAEGEVFAYTTRSVRFFAPYPTVQRDTSAGTHTCYRIRIGKKVINLCNHSGISDTTCVKMYEEDYWTLPGNFQLPVSVIKVSTHSFHQKDAELDTGLLETWLPRFSSDYVRTHMVAGRILHEQLQWDIDDRLCILEGDFACHEMIGQVKDEEIIGQNAEDN